MDNKIIKVCKPLLLGFGAGLGFSLGSTLVNKLAEYVERRTSANLFDDFGGLDNWYDEDDEDDWGDWDDEGDSDIPASCQSTVSSEDLNNLNADLDENDFASDVSALETDALDYFD